MTYKRKILIDGAIFGLQKSGGISRIFAEMLLGLDKQDKHEIIFLLPKNKNIDWEGIASKLERIKVIKRRKFLTWTALCFRPDIWHSSYYVGFPFLFSGVKVITFHDMIEEIFQKIPSKDSLKKYQSLKKSDHIFSISSHSKNDLGKFWPEFLSKTTVIENGLSLEKFPKEETSVPYLLYLGRRNGYKNFLSCVKEILKDPRFSHFMIYAVGGETSLTDEELSLERVRWFKTLNYEEVQKLIRNCQALLYPSLYEGFGLPIIEAFHHEVPVLAYHASSIPEVAGNEYPLADVKVFGSLGDTLSKLLTEKEKWVEYGRQRRSLFTGEKMMQKLIELYETI